MKSYELRVLLVDDSPGVTGMMALENGARAVGITDYDKATDESSAIALIQQRDYHMLILDKLCPDLNNTEKSYAFGPKIAERARLSGSTAVIVGLSGDEKYRKYWPDGACDYFYSKDALFDDREILRHIMKERFQIEE